MNRKSAGRRVGWAIVIPVLWLGTGAALGFGTAYLTTQTKAAWQVVKANEEADKARQTADAAAIRAAKALLNEADIVDSARRSMQIIAVGRTSAITREGWVHCWISWSRFYPQRAQLSRMRLARTSSASPSSVARTSEKARCSTRSWAKNG